ncbi:ATP-dependent endonuclease [Cronobacter sakazakii]
MSNFRSIQKIEIDCTRLQIFVGYNDAGKSNILRALNLFFNNVTNPGENFNFKTDYNVYADKITTTRKKAKEIKITLTLEIPESYKKTNGEYIEWTKAWRLHEFHEDIVGFVRVKGPRGGSTLTRMDIPARSNLKSLLTNINFLYVPAIKDRDYLSKLRSEIYQVVNEAFNEKFNKSSHDFEDSIAENLQELTADINNILGFKSKLSLPKDLSNLFERLDFLNEQSISLNERGDGVKARHIPLILKFIAEKRKGLQTQGNPPYTFIWGYEEPENNLEILNSIKLADQFRTLIGNPVSQLFLTTHSPAFYNLAKQEPNIINCYYVDKDSNDMTCCESDLSKLDKKIGLLDLLAPHIEVMKKQLSDIDSVSQLGKEKPVLYIEGPSDEIILKKGIEIYAPEIADKIDFQTLDYGGGTNYVCDMLTAYFHMHKHHPSRHRAIGVVDPDKDGDICKNNISELIKKSGNNHNSSIKCIFLKLSDDIVTARKDGFSLPGVLEDNYPLWIWQEEHKNGKLLPRNVSDVIADERLNSLITSATTLDDILTDKPYILKVKYMIAPDRKMALANKLANIPAERLKDDLIFVHYTITTIRNFLKI